MALNTLKPRIIQFRTILSCSNLHSKSTKDSEKSIYEQDEEDKKEVRIIHGEPYPDWRKHWGERKGEWRSKLSLFVKKNPSPEVLTIMQKVPDWNIKVLKDWWVWLKEKQETVNQRYISQRVEILGSNLAAVHFFMYRGASVRLRGSRKWLEGNPDEQKIPSRFVDGYYVEGIDCSSFKNGGVRFEGLENLLDLNFLKWLSLKNNKYVDDWCIDRIAGQNGHSLEFLDISGCSLKKGCVFALARMHALKVLVVTDPQDDVEMQTALSALEDDKPNLILKTVPKE